MRWILLVGNWSENWETIDFIMKSGYVVGMVRETEPRIDQAALASPCGLIARITCGFGIQFAAGLARDLDIPWIAWDESGVSGMALEAYRSGAKAVLPMHSSPSDLDRTAAEMFLPAGQGLAEQEEPVFRVTYGRDETIRVGSNNLVEIQTGVVAMRALHPEGLESLLGLFGPGDLMAMHPQDGCYIELTAHTETTLLLQPWSSIQSIPDFLEKLRLMLVRLNAWAAMQACPQLDLRVTGLLSLLSERFGRQSTNGVVIDVRLTHGLIASAVCATRPTVTRILGELVRQRKIGYRGRGMEKRIVITSLESRHTDGTAPGALLHAPVHSKV